MSASQNKLESLHDLVADTLIDALKDKPVDPETGVEGKPDPRYLANAIKFLKDNGIDAPASPKLNQLAGLAVPFADDDHPVEH